MRPGAAALPGPTAGLRGLDYSVLQQCMHCGMCLPTCPTYAKSGRERHSPRGRIALMRAIADEELQLTRTFADEMDFCLGCLACTTACPAGVDYATLFETARAEAEQSGVMANPRRNALRGLTLRFLFKRPRVLRAVGKLLWAYQASGVQGVVRSLRFTGLLPKRWRELEGQMPSIRRRFSDELIAPIEDPRPKDGDAASAALFAGRNAAEAASPTRTKRYRVVVLTGCVQDLLFSDVNRATVDVLLANGCAVHTPSVQHCCGSLHAHNGDQETARWLAQKQLDTIDPFAFDAIISNAGGCGSHLRHYERLLAHDGEYRERAKEWSRKLRDVHEWLVEIGFRRPSAGQGDAGEIQTAGEGARAPREYCVTYHESCHLCHGQKVSAQPREVLRSVAAGKLVETAEANWCCGSAGIYSLTQPETADWLLQRKVANLQQTGAAVVATANPGCHLQLEKGLAVAGSKARVVHPVVLLAEAYRRERHAPRESPM